MGGLLRHRPGPFVLLRPGGFFRFRRPGSALLGFRLCAADAGEQADVRLNLSFAALVQCAINPACVLSAGFVLSYGAVLGIALLYHRFKRRWSGFSQRRRSSKKRRSCSPFPPRPSWASAGFFVLLRHAAGAVHGLEHPDRPADGDLRIPRPFRGPFGAVWGRWARRFPAAGGLCVLMRAVAKIGGSIPFPPSRWAVDRASSPWADSRRLRALAICEETSASARRVRPCAAPVRGGRHNKKQRRRRAIDHHAGRGPGEAIVISCGGHTALLDGGNRNVYTDKGASVVRPIFGIAASAPWTPRSPPTTIRTMPGPAARLPANGGGRPAAAEPRGTRVPGADGLRTAGGCTSSR